MPRKEVVRPLGAKPNQLGMKRKNAPGRAAETTAKLTEAKAEGGKRCCHLEQRETATGNINEVRCDRAATEFVRFAWWCGQHAPEPGRPDCEHSNPSYLWGRLVCTWCGADCGPIPEKVDA